jgi:hypothetical protein
MQPASWRLFALGLVLAGVIYLVTYRPTVRQDLLDGTYTNPDCPGFEVRGGTLRYASAIPGWRSRSSATRGGDYLLPQRALRYDLGPKGCRLLHDGSAFKLRAVPDGRNGVAPGLEVYSADLRQAMVWTRTAGSDQADTGDGEKRT